MSCTSDEMMATGGGAASGDLGHRGIHHRHVERVPELGGAISGRSRQGCVAGTAHPIHDRGPGDLRLHPASTRTATGTSTLTVPRQARRWAIPSTNESATVCLG